jgi:hypothetical protein
VKTLALQRQSDSARAARPSARPPHAAVLAQRRSTLGPGGSAVAPPITDAGRPLDTGTRGDMEASFGRDFSNIRVHDDARAHDSARALGARAYAAGDHLVFGEGAYRPESTPGRALIAHELAHSVQQDGVQMKTDGPILAGTDAALESQADRAALDVTAGRRVSGLTRIGRPAIFRADGDPPAAPAATATESAGSATDLPGDVQLLEETPKGPGATILVVSLPVLALPRVKGKGKWVQDAYSAMASGNRLLFSPIFDGKTYEAATSIKAFMEKPGDKYKDIWLNNYGFTSLKDLAKGIRTSVAADPEVKTAVEKPEVNKIVKGFEAGTLTAAKCDIDHIVEKQVGGTSVPSNLQLLVSDKNQESGRQTYNQMIAEVKRILEPNRKFVKQLQIRFKDAKVPEDVEDGSFEIESLLRAGKIKGSEEVMKKGEGTPIQLLAGGASEVIRARGTGATPIHASVRRLIPGMKFVQYKRGAGSRPTKGTDTVEAELASKPMLKGDKNITLSATVAPAPPASTEPTAGASEAEKAAASEVRQLKLDPVKNKDIPFYYPYLSKGKLTKLALDDQNNFTGEGVITPSVKFLGDLKVAFGPDTLVLVQDIDTAAINSSKFMKPIAPMFRFTSGSISIDLVKFKPKGTLDVQIGPKAKPIALGNITATEEGGNFVAVGTLTPAAAIPGIRDAKGQISYRSDTGWSGLIEATSSSIPKSTTTVKLGFKEENNAFRPYAEGSITTTVRKSTLNLNVKWSGGAIAYWGSVKIEKPLPLVEQVELKGSYANDLLRLTGEADIKWKSIAAKMTVTYRRKDGDEEGKFSGKAGIDIKTDKADGRLELNFAESGAYWGGGFISYQITKEIRPKLGVEITKDRRIRTFGEVKVADIPLTKMWPAPAGGKTTFIKGAGVKFNIPTPVPAVTAYGQIKVSAGLGYGVGPVMLKGVVFTGELYPLEDDPQVKANLKGKLSVPAYGEIYGTFGAYIGLEVALGAVGAKGGIEVTPALRVQAEAVLDVNAAYESQSFTFSADAYVKGQLIAKLKVDLMAELYAAWGLFSHTWTYNVAALEKPLGPELKLTLGKVGYGKGGEITLPSASQISLEPKDIDPLDIVKDLMRKGKATAK